MATNSSLPQSDSASKPPKLTPGQVNTLPLSAHRAVARNVSVRESLRQLWQSGVFTQAEYLTGLESYAEAHAATANDDFAAAQCDAEWFEDLSEYGKVQS